MDAKLLDELADIPGVAWYGLQKPSAAAPLVFPALPGLIDLSPYMGDFLDTAQILEKLDLVVSVDTSVAHLAGLLGRQGVVLLTYMPDWRWGLGQTATRWYPSLGLVRQPSHGDWRGAISLLKEKISRMASNFGCPPIGTS
jgi:hypothetical protein